MRLELTGFAPDLDPETPGILTDCNAIVPTTQGLAAANSPISAGLPAILDTVTSAYVAVLLDGSKRVFVAEDDAIQEAGTGAYTDRSRVGGYTGTNRMRWAVFGNNVLATNRSQLINQAAPGGSFADIADAPLASIIVTAAGFVMALNVNDGQYGDAPDGWHCSAIRDQTNWTASAASQSAFGRLLDSPGDIRAGAALGSDVVAYKETSMYLGRYVGPPLVWSWTRVPGDIGTSGNESVVTVGTQQFFIGPSDLYVFDGTVPRSLNAPIREWFFANLNQTYRDRVFGVADLPRDLVYWYYPSTASTTGALDSVLIYNFRTNRWGKQAINIQAPLLYSAGQVTYDGLGSLYSTYDSLPDIAYDSPFWLADSTAPAIIGTDGVMYRLTGEPGASWLITGDFGDLTDYMFVKRVTPRYRSDPASGQLTNFYRDSLGASKTQDQVVALSRKRFDLRRAARWHSFRIDHPGRMTLNGLDVAINEDSPE